jgi:hypothetical protein
MSPALMRALTGAPITDPRRRLAAMRYGRIKDSRTQ